MANLASILKQSCMDSGECIMIDDAMLKLIQKKLLTVMDDIISVCQENGIDYQLSGGSVLGAVRHQGYIQKRRRRYVFFKEHDKGLFQILRKQSFYRLHSTVRSGLPDRQSQCSSAESARTPSGDIR